MLGKLGSVHPYVRDRVSFILSWADWYGGSYTVTSGLRTESEQLALIRAGKTSTPPGCSQHQYGLAVDVAFSNNLWQEWYLSAARSLGLITVPGDPVHVQTFPGSSFREYAVDRGLCSPAPKQDPFPVDTQTALNCGPGATRSSCRPLRGCTCYYNEP